MPSPPDNGDPGQVPILLADAVARLRRAMRRAARQRAPELGLSVAELEVMTAIATEPGSRAGDLAQRLRLAPNTLSTLATRLDGQGLIERSPGTGDRRTVELSLSDSGQAALDAWQHTNIHLIATALSALPEADRRRIRSVLPAIERLVDLIDAQANT
jgi:DNA-binding MarR family transcriptional regulator